MQEPVWCVGVDSAGRKHGLLAHWASQAAAGHAAEQLPARRGAPLRRRQMDLAGFAALHSKAPKPL